MYGYQRSVKLSVKSMVIEDMYGYQRYDMYGYQ